MFLCRLPFKGFPRGPPSYTCTDHKLRPKCKEKNPNVLFSPVGMAQANLEKLVWGSEWMQWSTVRL